MQQGVFLARHVSGTYAHHQEHWMLSCSIWFSAQRFWIGGGLESRCFGRVYGADGAVRRRRVTCRAKNTLIKLPCCIKLAFQVIPHGMIMLTKNSNYNIENRSRDLPTCSAGCNRYGY